MVDFDNIHSYEIKPPDSWTYFGSPDDFDALSKEHKDQIKFLSKEASDFLYQFFSASKLHTGPVWDPFQKGNFKHVDQISLDQEESIIKKWLYNRGIPFSKWVYVLPGFQDTPAMMTWKIVVKYCTTLFFRDDIVIFDKTNQWCLSYWHEDVMFFGKINTVNPEVGYQEMKLMNQKEQQYPGYKNPLKP